MYDKPIVTLNKLTGEVYIEIEPPCKFKNDDEDDIELRVAFAAFGIIASLTVGFGFGVEYGLLFFFYVKSNTPKTNLISLVKIS